jgi:hypothetical protein
MHMTQLSFLHLRRLRTSFLSLACLSLSQLAWGPAGGPSVDDLVRKFRK